MTDQRWQKIEEIFLLALDRTAQERAGFVAEACGGDDEMLREVHSLIAAHEKAEGFIESPVFEDGLRVVIGAQNEPLAVRRIGPYKIIEEIGRGGMGVVYRAMRADDEYHKEVAIKLIRRGFDSDFIVSRFRHERQILANLAHPNITRLLDGGKTEEGLPYLVMEYIEGEPIDAYCDAHRLSINERLKLFRTVCSAVHYAHQNLIVHRDIKPGNILVTADGTVKLLDFGIAKLLSPEHPSQTTDKTTMAMRLMTPEYASPEQLRGETITTATDVYSLGVLLYKLLTGHHPYRFNRTQPHEIERAICEEEPERPSAALSRMEEVPARDGAMPIALTPESVSAARATEPQTLRRKLSGDLDNIVLMAMRKEAQRRYVSVERFSEDLRRHLEGRPVMAHKDTFGYRSAKFIRRNKVAVAAVALVTLILIAGIIATEWQAKIAAHQAKRAAEQAKLATEQRNKARIETAKAERINAFLQTIFSYADPSWYSPGRARRDIKVIDALNEAAGRIDRELANQPEVRAELHHTIGNTYRALGFYDKAERHFRAALALYREIYGGQHPKVAESLYYLSAARHLKGDRASAEALYRQAIAMMRALDKENVNLPYILEDLGWLLIFKPDTAAAEPLLKEALELFRQRYGEDHAGVATTYQRFGLLYEARGNLDRAQALFEETVEREKRLADGRIRAEALTALGRIHRRKGEYAAAETALMEALASMRKSVGDRHPSAAQVLYELADTHCLKHDYVKAEEEARSALVAVMRRTSPEEGPSAIQVLSLLSKILIKAGQRASGQAYLRRALALYRTAQQKGQPDYDSASHLGECLTLLLRYTEAEPFLLEGYHHFKAHYGEQHPSTAEVQQRLVNLYQAWRKPEQAARVRVQPSNSSP